MLGVEWGLMAQGPPPSLGLAGGCWRAVLGSQGGPRGAPCTFQAACPYCCVLAPEKPQHLPSQARGRFGNRVCRARRPGAETCTVLPAEPLVHVLSRKQP